MLWEEEGGGAKEKIMERGKEEERRSEMEMFRGREYVWECDVGGMTLAGHHFECGDRVSQSAGSESGNRGSVGRSGNGDGEIGATNATQVNHTYCHPHPQMVSCLGPLG